MKKVTNGLDLQGQLISNVGDPAASTDAANRNYVDNLVRGITWKQSVRLAPTTNITLSAPGATFDGVTAASGDRLILTAQTNPVENGIYVWTGASAALTRATDADGGTELQPGSAATVTSGSTNANKVFIVTGTGTNTIGTSPINWTILGGTPPYSGTNGVNVNGTAISGVAAPSGGVLVSSAGFSVDTAIVSRKVAGALGNGAASSITVTHGLNTRDVVVSLKLSSTYEEVIADYIATDANSVTFSFSSAPATGAYRYTIHG